MVLIDFWTYTCINCIRTLPHLVAWDHAYRDAGLTIVGVHAPEFAFERKASNVERAIEQNGIRYPVAQDNEMATWNAWGNQYWPAKYLIDARGHVRYVHFGEGDYEETEAAIRALLREPGAMARPGADVRRRREQAHARDLPRRGARGALPARPHRGRHARPTRPYDGELPADHFTLGGDVDDRRRVRDRGPGAIAARARAGQGRLPRAVRARARCEVTVDGRLEKTVKVTTQSLYTLLSRPRAGDARHRAALLARRRRLRVHVRLIRSDQYAGCRWAARPTRGRAARRASLAMTSLAIETHGLGKRFGARAALESIDLEVPRGSAFGFLGRNGAGKTTLVRLLLGLAKPTSGTMRLLGHDLPGDRAAALARVGAIVEEPRFHPHLTGRENLHVHAAARDRARARARRRARWSASGLAARADDPVKGYSLGMRQRLGIARCLLCDPELLILDEPVNGLDPAGILEFRNLVRSLVAEGRTVLLSSHLLDEVEKTCDFAAIVDNGRVMAQGTIAELTSMSDERTIDIVAAPTRARPRACWPACPPIARAVEHDGGIRATLAPGAPRDARRRHRRCCGACSPRASRSSA